MLPITTPGVGSSSANSGGIGTTPSGGGGGNSSLVGRFGSSFAGFNQQQQQQQHQHHDRPNPGWSGSSNVGSNAAATTTTTITLSNSNMGIFNRNFGSMTTHANLQSFGSGISAYLKRILHFTQMDFEFAMSQMVDLCFSPIQVYRSSRHRKCIKDQWARDDPAFVVLLAGFLSLATVAYCVAFHRLNVLLMAKLILYSVLIDFIAVGCIIATVSWWICNKFLVFQFPHGTRQHVEWLYAFDVHCNAYFPLFLLLYVLQYLLLPFLYSPTSFTATLFSNTLYAAAFIYYHYVSFRGYLELPFLQNTERFLYYPIALVLVGYVLSFALKLNCTVFVMNLYFS